jgi:hypothetical protein
MRKSNRPDLEKPEPDAFSIRQFCLKHNISPAHFYRLRESGIAPVEMRVGGRILISKEAALRWRREREKDTTTPKTRRGGRR